MTIRCKVTLSGTSRIIPSAWETRQIRSSAFWPIALSASGKRKPEAGVIAGTDAVEKVVGSGCSGHRSSEEGTRARPSVPDSGYGFQVVLRGHLTPTRFI